MSAESDFSAKHPRKGSGANPGQFASKDRESAGQVFQESDSHVPPFNERERLGIMVPSDESLTREPIFAKDFRPYMKGIYRSRSGYLALEPWRDEQLTHAARRKCITPGVYHETQLSSEEIADEGWRSMMETLERELEHEREAVIKELAELDEDIPLEVTVEEYEKWPGWADYLAFDDNPRTFELVDRLEKLDRKTLESIGTPIEVEKDFDGAYRLYTFKMVLTKERLHLRSINEPKGVCAEQPTLEGMPRTPKFEPTRQRKRWIHQ